MTALAKGDRVYDVLEDREVFVVALGREASDGWLDDSHVLVNPHEPEADDCCTWRREDDLEPIERDPAYEKAQALWDREGRGGL